MILMEAVSNVIQSTPDAWDGLMAALSTQSGWLAAVVAWIGTVRVVMKPFNARLQTSMMEWVTEDFENEDRVRTLHRVLPRYDYRILAFLVDQIFSLKLVSHADLHRIAVEKGIKL